MSQPQNSSLNQSHDLYYNSILLDSPVARGSFSRFSRLADRSKQFNSTLASLNESSLSPSSLHHQLQLQQHQSSSTQPNLDGTPTTINLSATLQLPPVDSNSGDSPMDTNNGPLVSEEDLARLGIFESFFELNQRLRQPMNTFDLVDQFDQTCEENLLVSAKLLENKVHTEEQTRYLSKFGRLLRHERNTWRLVKALLSDRCLGESTSEDDLMEIEEDLRLRLSDHELVERAMERNRVLREMQIVIDWLESVADEDLPNAEKVDFYSDGPHYWENTLHRLKLAKKNQHTPMGAMNRGRTYCTSMDPDASIRTGQPLHDLDHEDEGRLFHHIYRLVRAGLMQDAKAIAERLGYFWLSAALEGWILHHDPNYTEDRFDEVEGGSPVSAQTTGSTVRQLHPIRGNPYRDLWKMTAWKCSKMEGTNLYERAIFGVFSGNRGALMPMCHKWIDRLWAYFKCSLDVHLEGLLIDSNISKPDLLPRNNVELPEAYWDNRLAPVEIFQELETQGAGSGVPLEEEYHQIIVQLIVLGKIDELVDRLFEWAKTIQTRREQRSNLNPRLSEFASSLEEEEAKVVEPNLLRLFAHLGIVLNHLELVPLPVEVLEIYIGFLIEFKLVELVAFYTAYLPEVEQVKMFAALLETIDNVEDRKLCVVIAKNAKLNLPAILSLVVENIRLGKIGYQRISTKAVYANFEHLANADRKSNLLPAVTSEDMRKISALEWLLLDDESPQYMELLWQANSLIRAFLLEQKTELAKSTFDGLPGDIVNRAYHEWKRSSQHSSNLDVENVVREYFCHKAYFDAQQSFIKWHNFFYTTKPREPVKPKSLTRLAERVNYEQKRKHYESQLEVWTSKVGHHSEITSEKLLEFLQFPEGIWRDIDNLDLMTQLAADGETEPEVESSGQEEEADSNLSIEVEPSVQLDEPSEVFQLQQERKQQEWTGCRVGQLDGLRRIYVPQAVLLLHSVFHDSGRAKECLQIADIVADEQRKLHACFTRDQMAELLLKLRESSIEILENGSDPLGYTD